MEIKNTLHNEKGELILMRNGHQSFCHLKAPTLIMQQTALGQVPSFVQVPCSSNCPRFKIFKSLVDDNIIVKHTCIDSHDSFEITDAPENNPSQLKLI
jgi:hypothetical protein